MLDNDEGVLEPRAFQISDQGIAMVRDGLLQLGSTAEFLAPRKGKSGEFLPSVLYKNKALNPGEDFLPDEMLVKVISMAPFSPTPLFVHRHFPLYSGSEEALRSYLRMHKDEAYPGKISDFALFCFLPRIIGSEVIQMLWLMILSCLADYTSSQICGATRIHARSIADSA
jgi:hypothetical protein